MYGITGWSTGADLADLLWYAEYQWSHDFPVSYPVSYQCIYSEIHVTVVLEYCGPEPRPQVAPRGVDASEE